ncbi:MAG: 30S ribosomal protein S17 [Patescibacteria group bacterium]|nr:30S ribosomal protein S17 [bacterium]MDZ4240795.1 30S ribosomal protein S17 [Patescibacteria group bacterium]
METSHEQNNTPRQNKTFKGEVVSVSMKDTVVVRVSDYKKHPKYKKFLVHRKRYKVHDAGNTCKLGDVVEIEATKPISKEKHFKVSRIVSTKTI